ncbi:unnamed protein product, partial [Symbiodinium microadriaticum]
NILANNNIEAIVAISSDIDGTDVLYNESHASTTNAYGIFSLEVGNGSGKSGVLEDVNWGSGDKYIRVSFRPEGGQYGDAIAQKLLTVPYALYAKNVDNVDDADADSTNELQTLTVNDSLLSISNGNTVKLTDFGDGFEANTDEQTLELTDGSLSISGGNEVDISVIDKDEQTLSLDGADLTISNGNTIDLGILGADTDDQAFDVVGLNGTNLELSLEDDGEATSYNATTDVISITNGGSVDITEVNTDNQTLSYNPTTDVISIFGGNSINISELDTDTDDQTLSYNATTDVISIVDGNSIDITEVNTDNQTLSYNPSTDEISIGGANTIDISEVDTDTDDQTLSYNTSTDVISIADGNSIDITEVNTDNQTLSYNPSTDEISIGGGNAIDISEVDTDTDDQTLSYNSSTDVISIADGNSIDITEVDTDDQTLSFNAVSDQLTISGGHAMVERDDEILQEASGIDESYNFPDHYWIHNDSGDRPFLYLINNSGEVVMTAKVKGAQHQDWEDITTVKDENSSWIYIGDIGDNRAQRRNITVYRIKEPAHIEAEIEIPSDETVRMDIIYAEGARDAETLMYDPISAELVLVTKRENNCL